jgi:hypothetical protein
MAAAIRRFLHWRFGRRTTPAWRGWDLIFIALWESIDISVPVCRRLVLLGLHHWFAMADHSVYPVVVLLFATFAGYAAGGTIYPPLFCAGGARGRHLPLYMKVLAGLFAAGGLAVGMCLLFFVYTF